MKKFDGKGMKFGLVILSNPKKFIDKFEAEYNMSISDGFKAKVDGIGNALSFTGPVYEIIHQQNSEYLIVDFDHVDGLPLEMVDCGVNENIIDGNYIVLMYGQLDCDKFDEHRHSIRIPIYALSFNKADYNNSITIDEIVRQEIQKRVNSSDLTDSDNTSLAFFNCFLQRYFGEDAIQFKK